MSSAKVARNKFLIEERGQRGRKEKGTPNLDQGEN
jgi:hypothetical protein